MKTDNETRKLVDAICEGDRDKAKQHLENVLKEKCKKKIQATLADK